MLKATDDIDPSKSIGGVIGVLDASPIHQRIFRNHLEHYDERLKSWIRQFGANVSIGTQNIGPKSAIGIPNLFFISHYDPATKTFTFVNDDFDLTALYLEVQRIKEIAGGWVNSVESRVIMPPYL